MAVENRVHWWQCEIAMSGNRPAAGVASLAACAVRVAQVGAAAASRSAYAVRCGSTSNSA